MAKKWKAGQIVTIKGKKYRIKRLKHREYTNMTCMPCSFGFGFFHGECLLSIIGQKYNGCTDLIPKDCYFDEINPKS